MTSPLDVINEMRDNALEWSSDAETRLRAAVAAASKHISPVEVEVPDTTEWPPAANIDTLVPPYTSDYNPPPNTAVKPTPDPVSPPEAGTAPNLYVPDFSGLANPEAPNADNIDEFTDKPDVPRLDGLFDYDAPDPYEKSFNEPFPRLDLSINSSPKPDASVPSFNEQVDDISTDGLFRQPAPSFDVDQFIKNSPPIDMDEIRDLFDGINYPILVEHDAPPITDINIKPAPEVTLPTYTPTFQPPVLQDPADYAAKYKEMYDSALPEMQGFIRDTVADWISTYAPGMEAAWAKLEEIIATDIEGGRGLSDEFEQDLYSRARTKIENERVRNERQLLDGMSKRGFVLPAGAVSTGLQQLHQASSDALGQQATEIAIERAKMEMQHKQFVMGLSQTVHQGLLNASLQYAQILGSVTGQAIEHAKTYAVQYAQIYSHMLDKARVLTDLAKLEVMVYETQVKAAMAEMDLYKVEIEAEMAKVEIDKARVQLYEAQIQAESEKVKRYVAQIDAVVKRADFERLQLDLFKAEVEAYVAKLQAKETEYKIYNAALEGDKMKLEAEMVKLEVYDRKLQAYEIQLRAKETEMRIYTASLEGDKTKLQAELAKVEGFGKQIEAFNLALKSKELEVKIYQTAIEADKGKLEGELAKLKVFATQLENYKTYLQGWEIRARVYAATLDGDKAKIAVEQARLDAYMKEVEAYKVNFSVEDTIVKSKMAYNNLLLEQYKLELDAYKIDVQAESTRFQAKNDGYKAELEAYIQKNRALLQDSQAKLDVEKERANNYRFNYEAKNKFAIERVRVDADQNQFNATSLASIGNMYGTMAASALAGQNAMVSLATNVEE